MDTAPVDSLCTICTRYVADNINETLLAGDKTLLPGITLPEEISENILAFAGAKAFVSENVKAVFKDTTRTRLQVLQLRNCEELTDDTFGVLMTQHPVVINIHNCPKLTTQSLDTINKYGRTLKEITIGNSIQIFPENLHSFLSGGDHSHLNLLRTPQVSKLVIWGLNFSSNQDEAEDEPRRIDYPDVLTCEFIQNLQHLDLGDCVGIEDFSFLLKAKKLRCLSFHNVPVIIEANWNVLKGLTELRHLDISLSPKHSGEYQEADAVLSSLVESLPHLASLDISGTNLGGLGVAALVNQPNSDGLSDIPGLKCRVNNPLEFLGLYGTHNDVSHCRNIPAKKITGNKNESQILNACEAYIDRSEVLGKVLDDLFHWCREEVATETYRSMNLILQAMNRHVAVRPVQLKGSASLYYLIRSKKDIASFKLKREILTKLVNAMDAHKDANLRRYAFLSVLQFYKPEEVMFVFEKLVGFAFEILFSPYAMLDNYADIAMLSLNYLCEGNGCPERLSQLGAIQKLLQLIEERINRRMYDNFLPLSWEVLRKIITRPMENCISFINSGGLELVLKCHNQFPNRPKLINRLIGVLIKLGVVSRINSSEFISLLYTLLDSIQGDNNMEVSYVASVLLIDNLANEAKQWITSNPTRQQILDSMARNINRWDINTSGVFICRSLNPIQKMLTVYHTRECQLWAAWTVTNLTRVEPEKFIPLLEGRNMLEHLRPFLNDESDIGRYAKLTFDQVRIFYENQVY